MNAGLEIGENININLFLFLVRSDGHLLSVKRNPFRRIPSQKRIPGDFFATLDGFQQKPLFVIAAEFEKRVRGGTLMLISDQRQKRQILNVDNDLKSMETPEGHGDSFWSNALMCHAAEDTGEKITFI